MFLFVFPSYASSAPAFHLRTWKKTPEHCIISISLSGCDPWCVMMMMMMMVEVIITIVINICSSSNSDNSAVIVVIFCSHSKNALKMKTYEPCGDTMIAILVWDTISYTHIASQFTDTNNMTRCQKFTFVSHGWQPAEVDLHIFHLPPQLSLLCLIIMAPDGDDSICPILARCIQSFLCLDPGFITVQETKDKAWNTGWYFS